VRPRAKPVTRTAPTRRLRPGDLICGECGEGNPATRKFCSRCGSSLVEAEVVRTPWWKKILPRRGPRVVAAGENGASRHRAAGPDPRHALRRAYRLVRNVVGILVVVAGLAYAALPPFRAAVNTRASKIETAVVNCLHPSIVPVRPVKVTASLQEPGHPGSLAMDLFSNTYWLAPWNPAHEPTLTVTFSHKVFLKELILNSGVSGAYVAHGRPSSLHLVFSNQQSDTITPQDKAAAQTLSISHAIGVTSVQIQITGIYQGNSGSDVGISEIQFFALQP
jgi:hypothetical protein